MPAHTDSVDKIITRYFSVVTTESFIYKGKTYQPKAVRVSCKMFVRRRVCVAKCGACCPRFSLDWIPAEFEKVPEQHRNRISVRNIDFDNRQVQIHSDLQNDHKDHFCHNLNRESGMCGIHGFHPFSCDFEPIRFYEFKDQANRIDHRPFGRAWKMTRIDGEKGALCEWNENPCDEEWKQELIRKLNRLKAWTDYFGINTVLPRIIQWLDTGPHNKDLFVGATEKKGFEVWMT